MKTLLLAAFMLVLSSCANLSASAFDCDGRFTYSAFDYGQRVQLANVRLRWMRFTGRALDLRETPDRQPLCHISSGELAENVSGAFFHSSHAIVIDTEKVGENFEATVLHELGHEAGMGHVEDGSIMSPQARGDWNEADRAECVRVGFCD